MTDESLHVTVKIVTFDKARKDTVYVVTAVKNIIAISILFVFAQCLPLLVRAVLVIKYFDYPSHNKPG